MKEKEEASLQQEEPMQVIKLVKASENKTFWARLIAKPEALVSLLAVVVSVVGIVTSSKTASMTASTMEKQNEAQLAAVKEQNEAQRLADRNNRFTYAIEHLKDETLAIRMGALYELKKLVLEDEGLQELIVRILGPYIRDGIENRELLPPKRYEDRPRPQDDVFLACEITSLIYEQSGYVLSLNSLSKENLDLSGIHLKGADLSRSHLNGTDFSSAQLQEADFFLCYLRGASLWQAQLQDAEIYESDFDKAYFCEANLERTSFVRMSLFEANLSGTKGLTAVQLLTAYLDDTTLLDPDLRAEYDRLKTEQGE